MAASGPARIGLFGGSFDPVHQAHLALARVAASSLKLTELRWVPVGHAWQKSRALIPAAQRVAMLQAALQSDPIDAAGADAASRVVSVVDDCEVRREGPSYTIDTLTELRAARPDAELFLIIGQDQYAGLHTWQRWQEIVQLATLAVAARAGQPVVPSAELARVPHRVLPVPLPAMAVSSTDIRARLAQGATAASLVPVLLPATVASYIDSHHLYAEGTPR
jgi:nicotinate-nucleotide adenylyltransferase